MIHDEVPREVGPLTTSALTSVQTEALRRAFVHDFNSVVITDGDLSGDGPHVLVCNPAFLDMTGYQEEELIGRNLRMLQGPDTDLGVISHLRACLEANQYFEGETVNYRKDGVPYLVRWNISPVFGDDGEVEYFISVQQERTREARAIRERELLLRALESASDPVLVLDADTRIVFASHGSELLTGYDTSELVGRRPNELHAAFAPGADASLREAVRSRTGYRSTSRWRHKNGRLVDVDVTVAVVLEPDGSVGGLVCTAKDVTAAVQREHNLQAIASTDSLTGLLTRRAGQEALDAAQAAGREYSVLLGDVDHFKLVNDNHGHQVGDVVLQRVAATVQAAVRSDDVAVRWGGEEVLVLLPGTGNAAALALAERLRAAIAARTQPGVGQVTISIGVATGSPGEPADDVVARADTALYAAKRGGRDRVMTGA
ncbi:sensor domain-containing diguanylate cyclase [Actinotalea ferrariae]|uniref:sensor domain-containing diguanylate cyclase n=1 Tax=Actinotalea ferrariae TaxID=1386098 RepID=UPI000B2802F2|nr:diguanylate cyclase [Actinotalea ferrariae]